MLDKIMRLISLVITVNEMRVLETNTIGLGIPLIRLMEAAGKSVADTIASRISPKEADKIVVLMGRGGNGGDSLVASRYLASKGYHVEIVPAYRPELINHPDTRENYQIVSRMDSIIIHKPGTIDPIRNADIIIDGLLGTGVKGSLREPIKTLVEEANKTSAKLKLAIDTPTGLNPDTGEIHGVAFKADITVTFHDVKPGLLKNPDITGEIIVANIGIPPEAQTYVGPGDVLYNIPPRKPDTHKGMAGKIAVIGGSYRFTGAPALSGLAALEAGSDLAFIIVPSSVRNIIASYSPELITLPYEGEYLEPRHVETILKYIEEIRPHVVVIGPGLGRLPETLEAAKKIIDELLRRNINLVIDADALRTIEFGKTIFNGRTVLTPHRGEFKAFTNIALSGKPVEDMEKVVEAAKTLNATILLKAPIDIISDGYQIKLNKTGNPYMSIGGTGDVLTGIVASILAKTNNPFISACVGAYINGLVGDYLLHEKKTVSPINIIKTLNYVINNPLEIHVKTYLNK